jgi:hypothetical protein
VLASARPLTMRACPRTTGRLSTGPLYCYECTRRRVPSTHLLPDDRRSKLPALALKKRLWSSSVSSVSCKTLLFACLHCASMVACPRQNQLHVLQEAAALASALTSPPKAKSKQLLIRRWRRKSGVRQACMPPAFSGAPLCHSAISQQSSHQTAHYLKHL